MIKIGKESAVMNTAVKRVISIVLLKQKWNPTWYVFILSYFKVSEKSHATISFFSFKDSSTLSEEIMSSILSNDLPKKVKI